MSTSIEDLEKFAARRASVAPQWQDGDSAFWYSREFEPSKFEFILVNCVTGTRRRAFDHAKLAAELARQTGKQDIDPDNLPLAWLNVEPDGAWVRFQYDDRTWQFAADKLEEWEGVFDAGNFEPQRKEAPSPRDAEMVRSSITFINNARDPINIYWIDYSGEPKLYSTVQIGQRKLRKSFLGHMWRVESESGKRAVYVTKRESAFATVSESQAGLLIQTSKDVDEDGGEKAKTGILDGTNASSLQFFSRDHNIWTRDSKGQEAQLSIDGTAENEYREKEVYVSRDEKFVVIWQQRPAQQPRLYLVDVAPEDQFPPKLDNREYHRPGDVYAAYRPRLFSLLERKEISTDDELFKHHYELSTVGWSEDDKEYRFWFNERGHKTMRLLSITRDGSVRNIVEETSETFIDYSNKEYYRVLKGTNELLWASERDGYNHLYLFSLEDGKLKQQVTKGEWNVRCVERLEEDKRRVWIQVFGIVPGQNPYYSQLAVVNLDGSGLTVITEGDGDHSWSWSPGGKYIVDKWSRLDYPPQSVLRDAETGRAVAQLQESPIELLRSAGWAAPEPFAAPGRDGKTLMYGFLLHPNPLDRSKKYPVIEEIYAGPQNFYAHKSFTAFHHLRNRANQGYVMAMVDCMGTNWRSKAFHNVAYKNLADAGFPDRKAWLRAAAATRPWMDLDRVGCTGSSAGGQNAAAALIFHGDFYKAACAYSGCHDNRLDKLAWNEQWMGYPVDESYEASSNIVHAAKLTGKLLLGVGLLDPNVDPASTLRLVDALIAADKDFELLVIPRGQHRLNSIPWVMRKQDEFFRRHLRDV